MWPTPTVAGDFLALTRESNEAIAPILAGAADPVASEDMGLLVATPGSGVIGMLETKPADTPAGIEAATTSILVGTLDLASGITVHMDGKKVHITISNPHLKHKNGWLLDCLGSHFASITASVVAEAMGKPVVIEQEQHNTKKITIELGILQ